MESKFGLHTKYANPVDHFTRKSLSNFLLLISGLITTVTVSLSFNIFTNVLPNLFSKTSSKLFAKVNLETGL